ncbi:MAG: hypothetical protein A3K10_00205 [Bacteroidetes bacterium RIFCSPLOWO2_12_FULL_31_6]|nr:MAG: hypothetical protein A3K10_00205 [Bacteroidetes bacterium RIFCSPLOWO2_12_FULL_31_6]
MLGIKRNYFINIFTNLYICLLVYCITATSCNSSKTEISGTITSCMNDTLVLEKLVTKSDDKKDASQKFTTVTDKDGSFKFSFETNETAFYNLRLINKQMVILLISPKDNIEINGLRDSLASNYTVEGSTDCDLIKELNQHQVKLEKVVKGYQSLRKNMMANMKADSTKANRDSLFKVMMIEEKNIRDKYIAHKQFIREFIDQHSNSLVSLIAMARLDQNEDFEYIKKIDSTLTIQYPNSPYLTDVHKKVEELKIFAIGATPPDIISINPQGKTISLSSLKGKLVLICFWASLNKPSRIENRTMTSLYKNYHDKGLEILSVSFDMKKEDWISAIHQDSLVWETNVSDLKGMHSQIATDYKLKNIPFNMLIGFDGKIIAKGLKGLALSSKIEEVLKTESKPIN